MLILLFFSYLKQLTVVIAQGVGEKWIFSFTSRSFGYGYEAVRMWVLVNLGYWIYLSSNIFAGFSFWKKTNFPLERNGLLSLFEISAVSYTFQRIPDQGDIVQRCRWHPWNFTPTGNCHSHFRSVNDTENSFSCVKWRNYSKTDFDYRTVEAYFSANIGTKLDARDADTVFVGYPANSKARYRISCKCRIPDIRPDTWLDDFIFGKMSNEFIKAENYRILQIFKQRMIN
jgi:hypothetical protein